MATDPRESEAGSRESEASARKMNESMVSSSSSKPQSLKDFYLMVLDKPNQ